MMESFKKKDATKNIIKGQTELAVGIGIAGVGMGMAAGAAAAMPAGSPARGMMGIVPLAMAGRTVQEASKKKYYG